MLPMLSFGLYITCVPPGAGVDVCEVSDIWDVMLSVC